MSNLDKGLLALAINSAYVLTPSGILEEIDKEFFGYVYLRYLPA